MRHKGYFTQPHSKTQPLFEKHKKAAVVPIQHTAAIDQVSVFPHFIRIIRFTVSGASSGQSAAVRQIPSFSFM